jgi:hypothetical protein
MAANSAELVDGRESVDGRVIFDANVPREGRGIAEYRVVTHDAIMRHVRRSHEQIPAPDSRDTPTRFCAAAHRNVLAKRVCIAGNQLGPLTGELQILRITTNRTKWMKNILAPKSCRALYQSVRMQKATLTQLHIIADYRKSPDAHAIT